MLQGAVPHTQLQKSGFTIWAGNVSYLYMTGCGATHPVTKVAASLYTHKMSHLYVTRHGATHPVTKVAALLHYMGMYSVAPLHAQITTQVDASVLGLIL